MLGVLSYSRYPPTRCYVRMSNSFHMMVPFGHQFVFINSLIPMTPSVRWSLIYVAANLIGMKKGVSFISLVTGVFADSHLIDHLILFCLHTHHRYSSDPLLSRYILNRRKKQHRASALEVQPVGLPEGVHVLHFVEWEVGRKGVLQTLSTDILLLRTVAFSHSWMMVLTSYPHKISNKWYQVTLSVQERNAHLYDNYWGTTLH